MNIHFHTNLDLAQPFVYYQTNYHNRTPWTHVPAVGSTIEFSLKDYGDGKGTFSLEVVALTYSADGQSCRVELHIPSYNAPDEYCRLGKVDEAANGQGLLIQFFIHRIQVFGFECVNKERKTEMSFEGYYQCLCSHGHAFDVDCFSAHSSVVCPHCKRDVAWWNLVDETNGMGEEFTVELKKSFDAVTFTCGHCDQTKLIEPPRFFIPLDKGHKGKLSGMYEDDSRFETDFDYPFSPEGEFNDECEFPPTGDPALDNGWKGED